MTVRVAVIQTRTVKDNERENTVRAIEYIGTPETQGIIGEKQLKLMKNTAHIINTSRGRLIDEKALVRALKEKWICGAGLDMYEEPPGKDNPLLELSNVVATPHIAWYTDEARMRLERMAVDRAVELLQGKIPRSTVNREALK